MAAAPVQAGPVAVPSFWNWDEEVLFVHIPKNAGTSIAGAFRAHYEETGKRMRTPNSRHGMEPAAWYRNTLGKDRYDELFTFAVVRNPWDRVASQYRFSVIRKSWKLNRVHPPLGNEEFKVELGKCRASFKYWLLDFCENRHYWPTGLAWQDVPFTRMPQTYWTHGHGSLRVKKIYRYEQMDEMWGDLEKRFNIKRLHENGTSSGEQYRDYYDDETRAYIEEHYRDDIDRFGYEF